MTPNVKATWPVEAKPIEKYTLRIITAIVLIASFIGVLANTYFIGRINEKSRCLKRFDSYYDESMAILRLDDVPLATRNKWHEIAMRFLRGI